jgi:hypothetical protein
VDIHLLDVSTGLENELHPEGHSRRDIRKRKWLRVNVGIVHRRSRTIHLLRYISSAKNKDQCGSSDPYPGD